MPCETLAVGQPAFKKNQDVAKVRESADTIVPEHNGEGLNQSDETIKIAIIDKVKRQDSKSTEWKENLVIMYLLNYDVKRKVN